MLLRAIMGVGVALVLVDLGGAATAQEKGKTLVGPGHVAFRTRFGARGGVLTSQPPAPSSGMHQLDHRKSK